MNYKSMYFRLFNRVTDAISLLQDAQLEGEDSFIEGEDGVRLLPKQGDEEQDQEP